MLAQTQMGHNVNLLSLPSLLFATTSFCLIWSVLPALQLSSQNRETCCSSITASVVYAHMCVYDPTLRPQCAARSCVVRVIGFEEIEVPRLKKSLALQSSSPVAPPPGWMDDMLSLERWAALWPFQAK